MNRIIKLRIKGNLKKMSYMDENINFDYRNIFCLLTMEENNVGKSLY